MTSSRSPMQRQVALAWEPWPPLWLDSAVVTARAQLERLASERALPSTSLIICQCLSFLTSEMDYREDATENPHS